VSYTCGVQHSFIQLRLFSLYRWFAKRDAVHQKLMIQKTQVRITSTRQKYWRYKAC